MRYLNEAIGGRILVHICTLILCYLQSIASAANQI